MRSLFLIPVLGSFAYACGSEVPFTDDAGVDEDAGVDAAPDASPHAECDRTKIERCAVGRCVLSAPRSTLEEGEEVVLRELPVGALAEDALPNTPLCEVALPARLEGSSFTLSIVTSAPTANDTLFVWRDEEATRVPSSASGDELAALVRASGVYGATTVPAATQVSARLLSDPQRSDTLEARIRNVSASYGRGVTFDGTYTYVGSGGRVLMFRGVPAPGAIPEIILGQPDLDHVLPNPSAATLDTVYDIWADGTRVAVASSNRVLLWNQRPTESYTPADTVLGQADFVGFEANAGGVSARSLWTPYSIDSDGTRLMVGDLRNNRVLTWSTFPFGVGVPATGVIGQPTFESNTLTSPIYQAWGAVLDGPGAWIASYYTGLFRVNDALAMSPSPQLMPLEAYPSARSNHSYITPALSHLQDGGLAISALLPTRVAIFRAAPSAPASADFVIGQVDGVSEAWHPTSASSLANTAPLRLAAPYWFVGDENRTLVYDHAPRYFFEPADRVIGQAGNTTRERGLDTRFVSARALGSPAGIAIANGVLAVADRGNNRVLLYSAMDRAAADPEASVVLGQPDARSVVPNVDHVSPSARTLSGPSSVIFAGGKLVVADTENHRVLVWNSVPTTTGAPADLVLGQADMSGRKPNRDRGDSDGDFHSDAGLDGMFEPSGLASDGVRLFVADRVQHRVLVWDTFPTVNGQPASRVLGQDDGAGVLANHGEGPFATREDGLALPTALLLDGTSLYVADTENNRVLRWDSVHTAPTLGAVFGQADGVSVSNPNHHPEASAQSGWLLDQPATASAMLRPFGLALDAGHLYVSEVTGNRVHVFDRVSGASVGVYGQSDPTSKLANAGGLAAGSLSMPSGLAIEGDSLWISDSANHRLLAVPRAQIGAAATRWIGQPSAQQNGYSRSYPAGLGGAPRPSAVALSDSALSVAETAYNRVVVYDRNELAAGFVQRILGQPDFTSVRANAGGTVSARSLSAPRGVHVHAGLTFVADTGNHRVLVWDEGNDAIRVLGQPNMSSGQANRGGAASAASLSRPEGVFYDGTYLYVADTGNHRVLVWNGLPESDGTPADWVLGQADFSAQLGNRGSFAPSADSMASPSAVLAAADALFVADAQNNRVLRFSLPLANGAAAAHVYGQPDAISRVPATNADDRSRAAGPVTLAFDGGNLFVGDRDGRRISVYAARSSASEAERVIRTAGGEAIAIPMGLAIERTPRFTSRLVVADASRHQVVVLESVSRLREP